MIVVDASIIVKWFVEEEGHSLAFKLLDAELRIAAPDLIFSEVANVLWKKVRRGEVTSEQAMQACNALPDFLEVVIPTVSLIEESLALASRLDHPVYDCCYLVCAQSEGTKLVTADEKFISHVRARDLGHLVVSLKDVSTIVEPVSADDLSISDAELSRLLDLSDQFRNTLRFVEEQVGRTISGGTIKWVNTAELGPAFDSPARRRLENAVSSLTSDILRDLLALGWLGRGYDGNDWNYLRDHASGMLADKPLNHLGYIISLLSYVQIGVQKLSDLQSHRMSNPQIKPETQ